MNGERNKGFWGKLFLQMLLHPIFLVVYGLAWFYLARLARWGDLKKNLPLLALCALFFLLYLILFFLRGLTGHTQGGLFTSGSFHRPYRVFAALILTGLTLFFGFQVAQSSSAPDCALALKLQAWQNRRTAPFTHTNLFEEGLEGLLLDVGKKVELPDPLYLGRDFDLIFDAEGRILSFDAYLYGREPDGEEQNYLLSYDASVSPEITIYLLGQVGNSLSPTRLLGPMRDTLRALDLRECIAPWQAAGQTAFGLLYSGLEELGPYPEGVVYVDGRGETAPLEKLDGREPVVNYVLCLYLPNMQEGAPLPPSGRQTYSPLRYIYLNRLQDADASNQEGAALLQEEKEALSPPLS